MKSLLFESERKTELILHAAPLQGAVHAITGQVVSGWHAECKQQFE
jgi:hypothetical protein